MINNHMKSSENLTFLVTALVYFVESDLFSSLFSPFRIGSFIESGFLAGLNKSVFL